MDVFIINAAGDLVQPEKLFTIPAGISVLVLTEKGECMDGGDDAAIIEIAEAISAGEDDIATVLEDLNDTEADFVSPINAKVVEGGAQMLDNNLTFKSWGEVKKYKDGEEEEDKKITRADVEKHSQSFAHRLRDDEGDPVKKKSDIGKSKKKQTIALSALLTMYAENGSTGLFILDCCRRRLWDNKLFSQEAQRGGRKKKNRRRRRRSHTRRRPCRRRRRKTRRRCR